MKGRVIYEISKNHQSLKIDGDWNKPQWQKIKPILVRNFMGSKPGFTPHVQSKMMYDNENLYIIFSVKDRYVRCITNEINGPVWEDACVEFFFSPDISFPDRYFNLEVNCGGTPLMHYNIVPDTNIIPLEIKDIMMIEIAHSMTRLIDPEITDPVTWFIEYRIPLKMLEKYSRVTYPEPGISWKANFYKIAENSSNPHYLTWSVVQNPTPNFHKPEYFGTIIFK
jgi:Carbohydrate-binding family 9